MNEYISMKEEEEKEKENNECIFCFEDCNDLLHTFCKVCKHKFHNDCYKKWIKKCKSTGNKIYLQCVYCQNKDSIRKVKKFCCYYYTEKIF
jgi:hypothetical protein